MALSVRAWGSVGVGVNNTTTPQTISPGAPAGTVVGDALVLVTVSTKIDSTCATPNNWAVVPGFPLTSGTASGGRIYVFVRRADGSADDTPGVVWSTLTTGTSGSHIKAVIGAYQGGMSLVLDGSLPSLVDTTATTTTTIPAFTTATDGSMVIGIAVKWRDVAGTSTTATFTERVDSQSTNASGGELAISDKLQVSHASSGTAAVTWSNTVSARTVAISIAFRPAVTTITSVAEVSLAPGSTPDVRTGHSIKIRGRTTAGPGTLRAALYEGANNRSTDLETSALTTSLADYTLAITEANATNITSYADLGIRFWGFSTYGDTIVFEVDQLWLEIPASSVPPAYVPRMGFTNFQEPGMS